MEESRATKLPSLEEVKGQIAEAMQQKKIAAFRDDLMKKAKIQ
jgi:peptidyl-prolyl cis-trans isomerase C